MITNFLLNYEHELIEKKKELCKALKEKTLSIKQNEEFIRFIEMSEDNSYDLFAPQNFKNNINQERIRELNEKNIFLSPYCCALLRVFILLRKYRKDSSCQANDDRWKHDGNYRIHL